MKHKLRLLLFINFFFILILLAYFLLGYYRISFISSFFHQGFLNNISIIWFIVIIVCWLIFILLLYLWFKADYKGEFDEETKQYSYDSREKKRWPFLFTLVFVPLFICISFIPIYGYNNFGNYNYVLSYTTNNDTIYVNKCIVEKGADVIELKLSIDGKNVIYEKDSLDILSDTIDIKFVSNTDDVIVFNSDILKDSNKVANVSFSNNIKLSGGSLKNSNLNSIELYVHLDPNPTIDYSINYLYDSVGYENLKEVSITGGVIDKSFFSNLNLSNLNMLNLKGNAKLVDSSIDKQILPNAIINIESNDVKIDENAFCLYNKGKISMPLEYYKNNWQSINNLENNTILLNDVNKDNKVLILFNFMGQFPKDTNERFFPVNDHINDDGVLKENNDYKFSYWVSANEEFDLTKKLEESMVLYSKNTFDLIINNEDKTDFEVKDKDGNLLKSENGRMVIECIYGDYNTYKIVIPNGKALLGKLNNEYSNIIEVSEKIEEQNIKFVDNPITLSCDENQGSVSFISPCIINNKVTFKAIPNDGYLFDGWYLNDELVANSNECSDLLNTEDIKTYEAKFSKNQYKLNVSKECSSYPSDYIGEISYYDKIVDYDDMVTLVATSPNNDSKYIFTGFYEGSKLLSGDMNYEFNMPAKDFNITARWDKLITIESNNLELGSCSWVADYDTNYQLNSILKAKAEVNDDYNFDGWYLNGVLVSIDFDIEITVSDLNAKNYIARFSKQYKKEGNEITFGRYPQTKVEDETLIKELNLKAGTLPTIIDKQYWTAYEYDLVSDLEDDQMTYYMYYQDVDYDNNGTLDYRGVYFTSYRTYKSDMANSNKNTSYQDDNNYTTDSIYWFKYEDIRWTIIKEESGNALIISNLILDNQEFYPITSIGDNANNYELSNIRKWLNDEFYNTAFNDSMKKLIELSTVDNSPTSTAFLPNNYCCNDTSDNIYLLSYIEARDSNIEKQAIGTDYAKCQGLYVDDTNETSNWLLRSPTNIRNYVTVVKFDGTIKYEQINTCSVTMLNGIRPVCWIKL